MEHISWLARWSGKFGHVTDLKLMPDSTQMAMKNLDFQGLTRLQVWLNHYPKITELSVSSFSKQLVEQAKVSMRSKFVDSINHFLYSSYTTNHINWSDFQILFSDFPIHDDSGSIFKRPKVKCVPSWAYQKPPPCAFGLIGEDNF